MKAEIDKRNGGLDIHIKSGAKKLEFFLGEIIEYEDDPIYRIRLEEYKYSGSKGLEIDELDENYLFYRNLASYFNDGFGTGSLILVNREDL